MSLNETWETSLTKEMTLLPCLKKSNRRVSVDVASTVRFFHGTSPFVFVLNCIQLPAKAIIQHFYLNDCMNLDHEPMKGESSIEFPNIQ